MVVKVSFSGKQTGFEISLITQFPRVPEKSTGTFTFPIYEITRINNFTFFVVKNSLSMKLTILGLADVLLFPIFIIKQILLAAHQRSDEFDLFRKARLLFVFAKVVLVFLHGTNFGCRFKIQIVQFDFYV